MVLQDRLFPQNVPKYLGCLLNDGGIWYNINHTVFVVGSGMRQSICQRRHCFSAAGGNRQRVKAAWIFAACPFALLQQERALLIQCTLGRFPLGGIRLQPFPQHLHGSGCIRPLCPLHEGFCIQKITIYQAGIHHSCIKHPGFLIVLRPLGKRCFRQAHFLLPPFIWVQANLFYAFQPGQQRAFV